MNHGYTVGKRSIMKVLKSAEQKNAPLSNELYTEKEIENLAYQGYIFRINDNDVWRVSLTMCDTISVKYIKELGFYQTVAKHFDGTELYINL